MKPQMTETKRELDAMFLPETASGSVGRTPGSARSQVAACPVTVFVGPNNSGKSKVLMGIEQYCRTGNPNSTAVSLHS